MELSQSPDQEKHLESSLDPNSEIPIFNRLIELSDKRNAEADPLPILEADRNTEKPRETKNRYARKLLIDYCDRELGESAKKKLRKLLDATLDNLSSRFLDLRNDTFSKYPQPDEIKKGIECSAQVRNESLKDFLSGFFAYCEDQNVKHPIFDEHPETLDWSKAYKLKKEALHRSTEGNDFATLPQPVLAPNIECPYKGLASFEDTDADLFFGRGQQISEDSQKSDLDEIHRVFEKLRKRPFVAVLGQSGSGKSSLVKAGILSHTKELDWINLPVRLSQNAESPFFKLAQLIYRNIKDIDTAEFSHEYGAEHHCSMLAERLEKPETLLHYLNKIADGNADDTAGIVTVWVFIDQFEEIYQSKDAQNASGLSEQTHRFLSTLSDVIRRLDEPHRNGHKIKFLITIRSDFQKQIDQHPEFSRLVRESKNHEIIAPIQDREQLKDIIVKPAEVRGVIFDSEAAELILDQVLGEVSKANVLPLLEYALTEIWPYRETIGNEIQITLESCNRLGNVLQILPKKADAFFNDELDADDQKRLLSIFLSLASYHDTTSDNRYSKRKARWNPYSEDDEERKEWVLIQTLAGTKYRFLTIFYEDSDTDQRQPYVEIAHDSLLTSWPTVKNELDNNVPFFTWYAEVSRNAEEWLENGKDQKYLLSGGSLAKAEDYLNSARILDADTIKFIETSAAYHQQKERTIKWMRTVSISTLVVLLFFSAIAAIGLNEKTEEAELKNRRLLAEISSSFLKEGEVRLAILTALEALENNTQAKSRDETSYQKAFSTLIGSMGEYVELQRHYIPDLDTSSRHVVTSDLETVIFDSGSDEEGYKANVWSLSKSETLFELENVPKVVDKFQLSHSGELVTLTSHDGVTGKTWDLEKQRQLLDFTGRDIREIYVSKDKKYFMSRDGSGYSSIGYIDPTTHTASEIFSVSDDERLALSPDGCCFYHGNREGVSIYKINGLNYQFEKIIEDVENSRFIFSLDQRFILAFGEDGTLRYNYISKFIAEEVLIDIDISILPHIEVEKHQLLLSEDGSFFAIVEWVSSLGGENNLLHIFYLPSGSFLNAISEGYVDFTDTVLDVSLSSGHIIARGRNYDRVISNNVFDVLSKESRIFRKEKSSDEGYRQVKLIPFSRKVSAVNEALSFLSIFDHVGFPNLIQRLANDPAIISSEFLEEGIVEIKSSLEVGKKQITKMKYWNYKTDLFVEYDSIYSKRITHLDIDLDILYSDYCLGAIDNNILCEPVESANEKYKVYIPKDNKRTERSVFLTNMERNKDIKLFDIDRSVDYVYSIFSYSGENLFTYHDNTFRIWNTDTGELYKEWTIETADESEIFSFIINIMHDDEDSGFVFLKKSSAAPLAHFSTSTFTFDLFTGDFIREFESSENSELFYLEGSGCISLVLNGRDIYVKKISTGEEVFKFLNASSDVVDVDFNVDTNSILWTQSTGEVFIANIDNWSEENLIDAFRELTIRPLTQSERENFNLN